MIDYLNEYLLFCGSRKQTRNQTYKQAKMLQRRGDAVIFNLLCEEHCSRFKWKYEPADGNKQTMMPEMIERAILFSTGCGLHNPQNKGFRNYRASGGDHQSFYGLNNTVGLFDYVGRSYGQHIVYNPEDKSDIADTAVIYDNFHGYNPLMTILYYADRLSKIASSINAAIQNILGSSYVVLSREQAKDYERQRKAAEEGTPQIIIFDDMYSDGAINIPQPVLMSTPGASEELKTLFEAWDKTHADFLQADGIRANNQIDKKSGITPMELNGNRENVNIVLNASYNCRLRGIADFEAIGGDGLSCEMSNFESLVGSYDNNGNLISADKLEEMKDAEEAEEKEDDILE